MARIIRRPTTVIDWGQNIANVGAGNLLGDNNDRTWKAYQNDSGSIAVFPKMTAAQMPAGQVIAVAVGYRQSHGGTLNLYNGWPAAYIRVNGVREPATRSYKQDGFSTYPREVVGPPLYKPEGAAFTADDIDSLSADLGAAVGPIGPNTSRRWCIATELYLVLVTADPVKVPSVTYPGNGSTINTSSVNFASSFSGYDPVQPHRAVYQVARNAAFTEDVRTFSSDFASANGSTTYTSTPGRDSHTNLGPGTWYLRARGRDFRGVESGWSSTRTFTINHQALPVPSTSFPATVNTPYAQRHAVIPSVNGGRRIGARWQFSTTNDFTSNIVEWANVSEGLFTPGTIFYDPTPQPDVESGGKGSRVGYDDPSQYLSQGTWFARVAAEDEWGQRSGWSATSSFRVSHPPTTSSYYPTGSQRFAPETSEVTWTFSDPWPGDRQGSYEVTVYNQAGSSIWTSGQIASPLSRARLAIPTSFFGAALQWAVKVTDADGVASAYSPRQSFIYDRAPLVSILTPGHPITSGQPTISWTSTFSRPGVTQQSYRVTVSEVGTSKVLHDTGTVVSTATQISLPRPIFIDGRHYRIVVTVTDSSSLVGFAELLGFAQFIRPPSVPVAVSAGDYATEGHVTAYWSKAPDPLFVQWRLYRRLAGLEEWTLAAVSDNPGDRSLRDWLAAGDEVEYYLAQVASRDGSLVESDPVQPIPSVRLPNASYMLVAPSHGFAVRVKPSSDSFTVTHESSTMQIIGRGSKVNFGQGRNREGSLKVPLRDPYTARLDRMAIDALVGGEYEVWLRSPFGDAFRIALSEYSFEPLPGVGSAGLGDIELPYVEVMP